MVPKDKKKKGAVSDINSARKSSTRDSFVESLDCGQWATSLHVHTLITTCERARAEVVEESFVGHCQSRGVDASPKST